MYFCLSRGSFCALSVGHGPSTTWLVQEDAEDNSIERDNIVAVAMIAIAIVAVATFKLTALGVT